MKNETNNNFDTCFGDALLARIATRITAAQTAAPKKLNRAQRLEIVSQFPEITNRKMAHEALRLIYGAPVVSAPSGYVLFEDSEYVVLVTLESDNSKTGNMVQIWILPRNESPIEAVRSGNDSVVCFNCKHRGDGFSGRVCYVNVAQGPLAVWDAYQAGSYPVLSQGDYARVFAGRAVRFGAYGEPILIPLDIVRAIATTCTNWTGYTHQWARPEYAEYRAYVMASCDSASERLAARALGWRVFRARTANAPVLPGEIICPASDEAGKRTQCIRCKLCDGAKSSQDARKDIVIIVHGSQKKNFVSLDSLTLATNN
jgi:hypothetical protein